MRAALALALILAAGTTEGRESTGIKGTHLAEDSRRVSMMLDGAPVCGTESIPVVTFPVQYSPSGAGRFIPILTRSSDVFRTWPLSCDDLEGDLPLTVSCQVWDTCVRNPDGSLSDCGTDVLTPDPLISPVPPVGAPTGNCPTSGGEVSFDFDVESASYLPDHRYFYVVRCSDALSNTCFQAHFWWYDTTPPDAMLVTTPSNPLLVQSETGHANSEFQAVCEDNSNDYDYLTSQTPDCRFLGCNIYYHPTDPLMASLVSSDSCGGFPQVAPDGAEHMTYGLSELVPGFYRFQVTVADGATDYLENGTILSGNQGSTDFEWEVRGIADLSLSADDGRTVAVVGNPLTYTMLVDNLGPNAPGVGSGASLIITGTLPVGATVNEGASGPVSLSGKDADDWGCLAEATSPQTVTCTSGQPIPPMGSREFSFSTDPLPMAVLGTTLTLTAQIANDSDPVVNEPDLVNNSSLDDDTQVVAEVVLDDGFEQQAAQ